MSKNLLQIDTRTSILPPERENASLFPAPIEREPETALKKLGRERCQDWFCRPAARGAEAGEAWGKKHLARRQLHCGTYGE